LVFLRSVRRLLVAACVVVSSSPIIVTLMKEALGSSETSVLTRATRLTSQKTPFFIVTAVKTSNLKYVLVFREQNTEQIRDIKIVKQII
jgi:hypothetical protein